MLNGDASNARDKDSIKQILGSSLEQLQAILTNSLSSEARRQLMPMAG
jgi:hypothetical protein